MKLVTSSLMRAIDRETIDTHGISGPSLMENAGQGIAELILSDLIDSPSDTKVALFCGKGNNGGDGYVVARGLYDAGVDVRVFFLGPIDQLSVDARLNFDRAAGLGIALTEITAAKDLPAQLDCDIAIDAVFGTGFVGAPHGLAAEMIEYINLQDVTVVSIDLPSGLNADTGQHGGCVVDADYTYTLALPKYGLFLSPGRELAGEIDVVPIGIPDAVIEKFGAPVELITSEWVVAALPVRKPDGHKGDFGKLLVVGGSTGLTGAATLAALAAARSGCGTVRVGCPTSVQPVLAVKLTECMTVPLPDVRKRGALALRSLGEVRKLVTLHDALVIGPGLGLHHETAELVRRLLGNMAIPSIVDADALKALKGHAEQLAERTGTGEVILTPHAGEFEVMTGTAVPSDIHERIALAIKTARAMKAVLVLKGSPTVVASPGGICYLNPTGNSGMATGGSGDVLSGMIGSFLAQGLCAIDAARCGVYFHGLAGDIAAEKHTERAMIAGDLIETLPLVFHALE